jgi:O-acetyl-ADP-ribose deacetylase (regulator of RNase III)
MIEIIKGNIFGSNCQCIVNTVNCVGVMGAGIAYECRLRYPQMFERYSELCKENLIKIGTLWLFKSNDKWILNFPTKYHWKYESKLEYLEKGLQKFLDTYKEKGITSIAFPLLGASNGGISESVSIELMKKYLETCDIHVEIYYYDPEAYDDHFIRFKKLWNSIPEEELSKKSGLRIDFVRKVKVALDDDNIRSLSRLLAVKGIGDVTLEKSFHFINNFKNLDQQLLF